MSDVVDLARKLLRTAAPSSGASLNERTIAALEAARLVDENDLTVARAEASVRKRPVEVAPHAWVLTQALQWCGCSKCGNLISRQDVVWQRILPGLAKEFRHNTDLCRPAPR